MFTAALSLFSVPISCCWVLSNYYVIIISIFVGVINILFEGIRIKIILVIVAYWYEEAKDKE